MRSVADTLNATQIFNSRKSSNLKFLLKKRFEWMNKSLIKMMSGLEVGSGAGFAKYFIKNKNLKLTDLSNDSHLDFKNIDAQNTNFKEFSFDYVIASNMLHHVPFPMKFFRDKQNFKKNGKLIIFEPIAQYFCN